MKLELRRVTVRTERAQDARRRWPERESLLLALTDAHGLCGVGEAAPLPGYGQDTLDDVEAALRALDPSRLPAALERVPALAALGAVAALLPACLPSARMALETAALDLLAQQARVAAPLLLGAAPGSRRALAQLLGPAASPGLADDAARAEEAGFQHLKLKLGAQGQLERELQGVQAVRERVGTRVSLRLDANGVLTDAELEHAWPRLSPLGIELFEEPGALPPHLLGRVPLALDESLQGLDGAAISSLVRERQASCLVLKPMALGGLEHCWQLATRARQLGAKVVISHSFDGPFAWRAAAALALALSDGTAHGLAPHAGLDSWAAPSPPVNGGFLHAWREPGLGLPAELGFP